MEKYAELSLALEDMKAQSDLYTPTAFWDEASAEIAREICTHGVEGFRSLPMPLGYFVPTYGPPGGGFSPEEAEKVRSDFRREFPEATKAALGLEQLLSGAAAALADYRVLLAADDPRRLPRLHTFSESRVGSPQEHFEFDGRRFSRSSLNYLLGLTLLKKHIGDDVPRTVLEVGGGFGTLGEVLSSGGIDGLRYIDIDIPPTSFIAQYYLCQVLGTDNVATYATTRSQASIDIASLPGASVLCSWQVERLKGKVDLFVNFISFQEMEPRIVANYLGHATRLEARWILLRNIREGKQVRSPEGGVGVEVPILSDDYLSMLRDYELVERNVLPFGYRTVDGFHSELLLLRRKS